jgi:probable F420-dependent oxidoreductase
MKSACRPFRFGVQAFEAPSGGAWREFARRAESLGYSTLFTAEHYFGPGEVAERSKHRPVDIAPLSALATAAAATTDLRVGSRVFNADLHHPVVLAKELATLDVMSDGRLEVGLGAGWIEAEYEGLGKEMDAPGERISRLGEAVDVMKAHWRGDDIDIDGKYFRVHGFAGTPLPVQKPHPPIMIGGGRSRVLRMAGRLADIVSLNWDNSSGKLGPSTLASSNARATVQQLEWVREGAGERFDHIEVEVGVYFVDVGGSSAAVSEMAQRYGVTDGDLANHPHALIGSVDTICEALQERRERFGVSYITVMAYSMDDFAPVVDRLAGT